jgi:hypothetical protein
VCVRPSRSAEPSSFLLPSTTTTSAITITAPAWPVGIHDAPAQLVQVRRGQWDQAPDRLPALAEMRRVG